MTTHPELEEMLLHVKSLAVVVTDLYKQNERKTQPTGDIFQFVNNSDHFSGEHERMIQEMIAELGQKYANLKRQTKKKDVLIHSMEKIILDLNGGKFPEEIEEYVNHYEEEMVKQREESKKHYTEKKLHQHAVEVLECHHHVKDKLIKSHEKKMVENKERLVNTHILFTEEIDDKERQIYALEKEVEKLKKQKRIDVHPEFEKHIMNNAHAAVEEVIDHYEEILERASKENLDKHLECEKHKWTIDTHEADNYQKDRKLAKHAERFEEHSQIMKEQIMHLQMDLAQKNLTIQQLKKGQKIIS